MAWLVLCLSALLQSNAAFAPDPTCHNIRRLPVRERNKLVPTSAIRIPVTDHAEHTLYDVLGAAPNASVADLKRCYHELAKKTHPDARIIAGDDKELPTFSEISLAWETLSNSKERRRYDLTLQAESLTNQVGQMAKNLFVQIAKATMSSTFEDTNVTHDGLHSFSPQSVTCPLEDANVTSNEITSISSHSTPLPLEHSNAAQDEIDSMSSYLMLQDEVDFVGGTYKGLSGKVVGFTAKRVRVNIVVDGKQKVVTVMNRSISRKYTV
jgi:hypothetical protein